MTKPRSQGASRRKDIIDKFMFVRHTENLDGDVTTYGYMQAVATAMYLKRSGFKPDAIVISEMLRTWQFAMVVQAVFGLRDITPEVDMDLSYVEVGKRHFGERPMAFLDEVKRVRETGDYTMRHALTMSPHAQEVRGTLLKMLGRISTRIITSPTPQRVLLIGHSPHGNFAGDPATTPYGIDEGGMVLYRVLRRDGAMIGSKYIRPPLPGKSY